jgi:uncharacterized DUF497 family protein
MERRLGRFAWGVEREIANIAKHGVDFTTAAKVFLDAKRKIIIDSKHSIMELRHYCIGKVGGKIITVRFIYRRGKIRIFGAGYWRKGKMYYEEE